MNLAKGLFLASLLCGGADTASRGPFFAELPPANPGCSSEQGRQFRFIVTPLNSYGVKGKSICSKWAALEQIAFA